MLQRLIRDDFEASARRRYFRQDVSGHDIDIDCQHAMTSAMSPLRSRLIPARQAIYRATGLGTSAAGAKMRHTLHAPPLRAITRR